MQWWILMKNRYEYLFCECIGKQSHRDNAQCAPSDTLRMSSPPRIHHTVSAFDSGRSGRLGVAAVFVVVVAAAV